MVSRGRRTLSRLSELTVDESLGTGLEGKVLVIPALATAGLFELGHADAWKPTRVQGANGGDDATTNPGEDRVSVDDK